MIDPSLDDDLGRDYDPRLMRRFLTYVRPYRGLVVLAFLLLLLSCVAFTPTQPLTMAIRCRRHSSLSERTPVDGDAETGLSVEFTGRARAGIGML